MPDFEITIKIPEQHVDRVETAFNNQAGKRLSLESLECFSRRDFDYVPCGGAESKRDFAVRVISTLVRTLVRVDEYAISRNEYTVAIHAVPDPTESAPDGIII